MSCVDIPPKSCTESHANSVRCWRCNLPKQIHNIVKASSPCTMRCKLSNANCTCFLGATRVSPSFFLGCHNAMMLSIETKSAQGANRSTFHLKLVFVLHPLYNRRKSHDVPHGMYHCTKTLQKCFAEGSNCGFSTALLNHTGSTLSTAGCTKT